MAQVSPGSTDLETKPPEGDRELIDWEFWAKETGSCSLKVSVWFGVRLHSEFEECLIRAEKVESKDSTDCASVVATWLSISSRVTKTVPRIIKILKENMTNLHQAAQKKIPKTSF